ncbi:hypothetical protein [Streptomyces sp. NPDC005548]|uniref:hypothetical protein n=1 Tax=Streptomyces sp. NPDC005548 TaxID=3364724 RepID=UPI0036760C2F
MTTTPSPAAKAARAASRLLKAVLSLFALAAAVAGLPWLLAWATPVIWTATHDDLTHLLDRQDTGGVVLLLLVAVGWIGWAQFSFCAIRELIAQLRGRTWHPPRGLGASQRAAALLIGSILVLLPTGTALASDAHATPSATAAHHPSAAALSSKSASDPRPSAHVATSLPTYTVQETRPAESLWGIAERTLGDGESWREIAALNKGRTMADGNTFQPSSFLQPGWQLLMPDTSAPEEGMRTQQTSSNPVTAAPAKPEHVVTVHPGDSLSKIAKAELGNGAAWPALYKASRGTTQPDGLPPISNPDIIYAGQKVTVPGTGPSPEPSSTGDREHSGESSPRADQPPGEHEKARATERATPPAEQAVPPPARSTPATSSSTPTRDSREHPSPSTTPHASVSDSSATTPAAHPSGSAGSSPAADSKAPAPTAADSPQTLRGVLGAGALLAAAITAALALRRTLQRRRRKPGEKIAIASETSSAEALLSKAADPGGAAGLDIALRTMAHHLLQKSEDFVPPLLRAARLTSHTIHVLPEDLSQDPQLPFVQGSDGWWTLAADAVLLDEESAREVPAPYPGLVTLGSTDDGDLMLVNLAHLPALLLDGNPGHITEVCTSLALELGMSPWAGEVEVVTVGFGEELPQLLPTTRIAHMRHPAHALRDVGERLLEVLQAPETSHQPYLLLCASVLEPDIAWEFADIISKANVPVTLIAPASSAAAHFPEAETLDASLGTPQHLESIGTSVTLQRLEHTSYAQIATALQLSAQPAHPAEGSWQDVPDEPVRIEEPRLATTPAPKTATATSTAVPSARPESEVFPALLAATGAPSNSSLLSPTQPLQTDRNPPLVQGTPTASASENTGPSASVAGPNVDHDAAAQPTAAAGSGQTPEAPLIRVLGPIQVTRVDSNGHGPKVAQLAALLYFRPGRSAHIVCSDMDPTSPWTLNTLHARLGGLRRSLGNGPDGAPYVPRRKPAEAPYRLSPGVRCDWTQFEQLVEQALPLGPAGLNDLEEALALIQGPPFGGQPLPWAEPHQQEMITRIIDVAHTVATYRTPTGPHHDLTAARRAVACGLDVDHTAELLYRDWFRIEYAAGNRQGLHTAIARVQQVNRALDFSLEFETEQLINELLASTRPPSAVQRTGVGTGAASDR